MSLKELNLKNFRCFTQKKIHFDPSITVIEGSNGSGKTSLLEAIHYFCYVKSFRTPSPKDLIHFDNETFFLSSIMENNEQTDHITIGCSGTKRHVKINQKAITSYKELRDVCQIVTVTQEDIALVKESPEKRRSFIDHAVVLHKPEIADTFKAFRYLLDMRNAFLSQKAHISLEEFEIWTKKLWLISTAIQKERNDFLNLLLSHAPRFADCFLPSHTFSFLYKIKEGEQYNTWEDFYNNSEALFQKERFYKRTLFGAHLDDIEIMFNQKPARLFSSRGQQKLLSLFLKILQMYTLKSKLILDNKNHPLSLIFLIDDFLSDFDNQTLEKILKTCFSLEAQLIITTPLSSGPELAALNKFNCDFKIISL